MPTQNIYSLVDTWNSAGTVFTGIGLNVTDTASSASSLLMDLQVGGASQFSVSKSGRINAGSGHSPLVLNLIASSGFPTLGVNGNAAFGLATTGAINHPNAVQYGFAPAANSASDVFLSRRGTANLRLGAADAAAPVAQTLSVQSVVAGTTNTAGANLTITGSQGTGTGAGGSIVFQVAPAGLSGPNQNALATALTINADRSITVGALGVAGPSNAIGLNSSVAVRAVNTNFGSWTSFSAANIMLQGAGYIAWSPNSNAESSHDLFLYRDNTGILALRNGANAQAFRVYNTTDGTNSEFGKIAWSSNVLQIGTEKAGTGTGRDVAIQRDGTDRIVVGSSSITLGTSGTNITLWAGDTTFNKTTNYVDGQNIGVGTTNGTKIGTTTSQKLGFWNATPIVQPTTAVAAATVAATGTGDVVAASTTFDGYTIPQIVKALRNAGLLA